MNPPTTNPSAAPDADRLTADALIFHAAGRLAEAAQMYRAALSLEPAHGDANYGMGVLALQSNQPAAALPYLKTALQANPDHGQYWMVYIDALTRAGQSAAAQAMRAQGSVRGLPAAMGEAPSAEERAHLATLFRAARFAEMDAAARTLTLRCATDGAAWKALGTAMLAQGAGATAIEPLRQAARLLPNDAVAQHNLGNAFAAAGRRPSAEACFRRAVAIDPGFAEAHANLGVVLKDLRRLHESAESLQRALQLAPDAAQVHNNLGTVLADMGRLAEAEACFARALNLQPDYALAQSNRLLTLNYLAIRTPEETLAQAREYGRMLDAAVDARGTRFTSWQCDANPPRLRVGMVSGDFGNHPVGYFLDGLLAHLDRDRIELIAYPSVERDDELARRLRERFAAWKPLTGLDDDAAARRIHADGVHILIDLSGHTTDNRLPVFARKPAPVQVSWLGYFATTGVAEMDYLIADRVGMPDAHQAHFTERILYLPETRLCFTPPDDAGPISVLPALSNGYVTFGCFQNLAKVGDAVLTAWARILAVLPSARLRLQSRQLGEPAARDALLARLAHHGIAASRVALHAGASRDEYLAAHAEVDIILDTFPFPGGTTTCEALWMGVPTLTIAGDRLLSRQGASLLTAAGLADWVVDGVDDYVNEAVRRASDEMALAVLREGLRGAVSAAPLFDAARIAGAFEDALFGMWWRHARPDNVPC